MKKKCLIFILVCLTLLGCNKKVSSRTIAELAYMNDEEIETAYKINCLDTYNYQNMKTDPAAYHYNQIAVKGEVTWVSDKEALIKDGEENIYDLKFTDINELQQLSEDQL